MTQSTRWSEQRGREVVGRWERSGKSLTAFAREQGLSPQRVRYWRERVKGAEPEGRRRRAVHRRPRVVPGVVVDVGPRAPLTVHLPAGVVVEAQAAAFVEPKWVAALVRALEQEP